MESFVLFEGMRKGKGFYYFLEMVEEAKKDNSLLFNLSQLFERVAKMEGLSKKGVESGVWYFVNNSLLGWRNKDTLRKIFGKDYKPPKYGSFLFDLIVKILGL